MASLILVGLILVPIILLILGIFISLSSNSSNTHKKLPPGRTGWPLIGENLSFSKNPEKFVRDRMNKYSPYIFQTSIAGQRVAVLCGPLGNKFIFSNDNKLIIPWWPVMKKIVTFNSPENKNPSPSPPTSSSSASSLLTDHSYLKLDSIQNYVSVMDSTSRDHVQKYWVPYDNVKAMDLARKITFTLACRLFINYNDDEVNDLSEPFLAIVKGVVSAPVNIPGTPYHAAIKGGEIVKDKLVAIVKQRQKEIGGEIKGHQDNTRLDLLNKLLFSADKDGKFFSHDVIAAKILGYLIASFVATSNAITYVLSQLAEHPHIYDQVLKEQQEISNSKGSGELLTWADIQKMKYSWNVVCESLRIMAPATGAIKDVLTTDLTFLDYSIPKGWKVMWTPHSTNKDPKYFKDPEKFDPSRFEGGGPEPYTFVPFGGGPHMCAGKVYARINILVFLHNVVTRFKLKKMNPDEKIIYKPDPTPAEGLPLWLQPHKL